MIGPRGLALVKDFEGYHTALPDGRCKAYLDRIANKKYWNHPEGLITIGYGCTEGPITLDTIWTEAEAEAALLKEISKHAAAVDRLVTVPLTEGQRDALISFSYNLGSGTLSKSSLLRHLNAGRYDKAAAVFPLYKYSGKVVYRGLVRRRAQEMALFLSPDEAESAPPMPKADPEPPPPTRKEMRIVSRKWNLMDWIRSLFGLGATGGATFSVAGTIDGTRAVLDPVKAFAADYGVMVLIVVCVGGFVLAEAVQWLQAEDQAEGRYIPSGADDA